MREIEAMAGRDPTQLEDDVLGKLEEHNVPTAVCDKIMALLDEYQQTLVEPDQPGDDNQPCPSCDGSGMGYEPSEVCPACLGTGVERAPS
jgi:hypothetical protein